MSTGFLSSESQPRDDRFVSKRSLKEQLNAVGWPRSSF